MVNRVLQLRKKACIKVLLRKIGDLLTTEYGHNEEFWKLFIERNPRDGVVKCFIEVCYRLLQWALQSITSSTRRDEHKMQKQCKCLNHYRSTVFLQHNSASLIAEGESCLWQNKHRNCGSHINIHVKCFVVFIAASRTKDKEKIGGNNARRCT
jgi:hypothetical protein